MSTLVKVNDERASGAEAAKPGRSRVGRPRQGEREERRHRVLDAALAELVEQGYDKTTMLSIASRAGASKETLYLSLIHI